MISVIYDNKQEATINGSCTHHFIFYSVYNFNEILL